MGPEYLHKRWIFSAALVALFGLLVVRIFTLQVYNRAHYLQKSERNRIRMIPVKPARGLFIDGDSTVLVDNRPAYSVSLFPYEAKRRDSVLILLSNILEVPKATLFEKIASSERGDFSPVKMKRHISFRELAEIEERRLELPGILLEFEPQRYYPFGSVAPHAFGYLGEITEEELAAFADKNYALGDFIGKKGLEKNFEDALRGAKGYKYIEVDVLGREVGPITSVQPIPAREGRDLEICLDVALQSRIAESMSGLRGAVVVLDSRNGEVLALVSKPSFDLSIFTSIIKPGTWQSLLNDPEKPLFDRTVQGAFPPGSTFKLVLAAAALENGIITPEQEYECTGAKRLGRRLFDCWKAEGHGVVDLTEAIAQSCNVYFYNLSLEVGLGPWASYAKNFGFGALTGIDIPGEGAGSVPDAQFLDDRYGAGKWTRGMLLNLAVGQGDLLVTPLQMAQFAMAIANEGTYYTPHLVKKILDRSDNTETITGVTVHRVPGVSPETYRLLKRGMFNVVNAEKGTGRAAAVYGMHVSGKTGTAQNPHGDDHAWFIGFAPSENPRVAFCIFVENGGGGGAIAAPLARSFLEVYFENNRYDEVSH